MGQSHNDADAFFNDAPIGAAITEMDGTWRRTNRALAEMLGYSVAELQGTSFYALTHPDDLGVTHEAVRSVVSGDSESYALEKRLRTHDGSYLWVYVTTKLQHEPDHLITYVVDISDRKRADAAMQASEARYRRLFETAKDGILILDASTGRIIDANPFMTVLTGFTRDEFVGKRLWEIGTATDAAASRLSFEALQARDYVRYDDLPLATRSGGTVDVEFISNCYLVDGQEVIQCNIRDITARKRAEATLRLRESAIDAVSQGILITEPDGDHRIVYASPGFARMTGYASADVIGKNCRFLQSRATDRAALATLREAIEEERACTVELLNFRQDGTAFWNNVAVSPIREADGRLTGFVGVQSDVTQRRRLEAQFLQAQKMEAVGRLAGGVAHDFNNVLCVILSYADLVSEDLKPEDPLRADVGAITVAAKRAAELTRQLLTFSRQQVVDTRVLNLNAVLDEMEPMLNRLLGADIELTILSGLAPWSVRADAGQIEQVVMNLAVNARDAMPLGGQLTVETSNVEFDAEYARVHHEVEPGAYVLLAVSDTGVGMSGAVMARVFEPFFTTKEQGKGTGLGLATVFGIVKQSGGHVFVYSEPGHGTTFKIYLPRASGNLDTAPLPTSTIPEQHGVGTVLLVEDEDQVRVLARTILRRKGYTVLDAQNGGEAMLVCEQHAGNIDLLLTDVVLPRMSGRQLAERLAVVRPSMKVLYMSGYTDDAILQHGLINSGVAFLQKPFTPTSLARKVHEVLQKSRAESNAAAP